ncbi:MAG: hypothetical protein QNK31_08185 [Porticoccus sp.]|nr:hypothetical protein [Porticoccus sp.]
MTKAVVVHGFNVSDRGKNTTAQLIPYFENENVEAEQFSYGWLGLMGVYFLNLRIVEQLVQKIAPGDIGIGHSNGCVIIHMAAHYGAPFRNIVYINPALNSNVSFAPHLEQIQVYHNDRDLAVKFGSWLRALMPWAPLGDPLWGDMGARGYQFKNYKESEYFPNGFVNKFIHRLNLICINHPVLLSVLRLIFIPVAFGYWFILGPIELAATFYFNNIVSDDREMALHLSREDDARFVFYSFVIPFIVWGVGISAYNFI